MTRTNFEVMNAKEIREVAKSYGIKVYKNKAEGRTKDMTRAEMVEAITAAEDAIEAEEAKKSEEVKEKKTRQSKGSRKNRAYVVFALDPENNNLMKSFEYRNGYTKNAAQNEVRNNGYLVSWTLMKSEVEDIKENGYEAEVRVFGKWMSKRTERLAAYIRECMDDAKSKSHTVFED